MISKNIPENGRFLTIYKKHYTKKILKPETCPSEPPSETAHLTEENLDNSLKLDDSDPDINKENIDDYLKRFKLNNEKIYKLYFTEPINAVILKNLFLSRKDTEYQYRYCDKEKERKLKEERLKKKVILPEDTEVPSTTYGKSYRNPKIIFSGDVKSTPCRPMNNLKYNPKIEKILKIRPDNSEYMDNIGRIGELILEKYSH